MRTALIGSATLLVLAITKAGYAIQHVKLSPPAKELTIAYDFGNASQTITGAEIVMSNAGASVAGHVTDATSAPVGNYSVVVFPTDRSKWFVTSRFLRLARSTQDGSFEVTGLPPGEYWVAATEPIDGNELSGDWLKPETLERLSFRATRVTLVEKDRLMTVLRLIRR